MNPLLVLLVIALTVSALWSAQLYRRVRVLTLQQEERRKALKSTSKLLIDKNMELFDQNVRQQKQLASKEDFIGIVSHQLRTPATEVKWGLEALRGEMAGHAKGLELEYFEKLRHSAERMVALIDSLVRLMNVDEQFRRASIPAYDPNALIKRVAEEASIKFANKHITLTLALGAASSMESMDPDSLELVAENLVQNAYEYTPEGGAVSVTTATGGDGGFSFSVADTGIGIGAAKLATVFVKFQRSETAMRMNSGGMGLGLYLVKSIVERHGGTVGLTTEEGKGSTFSFILPAARTLT